MARQSLDDYLESYATIALDGVTHKIDRKPTTTTQGPITDPEGRHAPVTLAPWEGAFEILNEIFRYLRALEAVRANDPPRFPSRGHVDETGYELSVINSEAAVHLFDIDTIYKPAKRILDDALRLDRRPLLQSLITSSLQSRGYSPSAIHDAKTEVVFFSHQPTISVPAHIIGKKRPRSEEPEVMDEIQVKGGGGPATQENCDADLVKIKSGPGDYYCSLVTSTPPSRKPVRLLMVAEAKAPHKLTRDLIENAIGTDNTTTINLRQFIQAPESRPSFNDAINSIAPGSPVDSGYSSDEKWMAAVATQIYTTLLQTEARYGYITTGESYILVRIRPGEATKLEYAFLPLLAQPPLRDEAEDADWLEWLAGTPLARLSCLALLSMFGDGRLTESEVTAARATQADMIWTSLRHREQSLDEGGSFHSTADRTRTPDPDWTPASEQSSRKRTRSATDSGELTSEAKQPRLSTPETTCESKPGGTQPCPFVLSLTPPPDAPDELSEVQQRELAQLRLRERLRCEKVKAARILAQKREVERRQVKQQQADWEKSHSPEPIAKTPIKDVPFCTPRCIMSLKSRCLGSLKTGSLDASCPNFAVHQQHLADQPVRQSRNPASTTSDDSFARLQTYTQHIKFPTYRRDVDGEDPPILTQDTQHAMYIAYGATSAVLKVRLTGGYVLVAKCLTSPCPSRDAERLSRLRHESTIYTALDALQGRDLPVCLAMVDQPSHADFHASYRQFQGYLLLSWAGNSVREWGDAADVDIEEEVAKHRLLRAKVEALLGRIHSFGILQGDAKPRNFVVSDLDPPNSLNIIDFERATSKPAFHLLNATDKDAERRFQRASAIEMKECLRSFDEWAKHRTKRLRSLASKRQVDWPQLV